MKICVTLYGSEAWCVNDINRCRGELYQQRKWNFLEAGAEVYERKKTEIRARLSEERYIKHEVEKNSSRHGSVRSCFLLTRS